MSQQTDGAKSLEFPQGFLWGAATSAHQVEGNNVHSDWWAWEKAGKVVDESGAACDHYRRFAEDFDIAARLGHNAHRFSIEWARIEPQQGVYDEEALRHYAEVIDALRARGLEPIVTLHHFTSPQWLAAQGGWENPKVVDWFAAYVERVARALGSKVRYWMTINEPMVLCHMHYLDGVGPPGTRSVKGALEVTKHLVAAHALSYRVLHDRASGPDGVVEVSLAKALVGFTPQRPWYPFDQISSFLTNRVFNWAFLDAVTEGEWSVPGMGRWRLPEARDTLDYLGVNYYTRYLIRGSIKGVWPSTYIVNPHSKETTDMGWEVHPPTFTELLHRAGRYGKRLIVTENGIATTDDNRRWPYIASHLRAIHKAIEEGTPVMGYLHWSLLDNFEWACGFSKRFGLIEMDYATLNRRVKPSAEKYAEVCRSNRLNA